MRSFPSIAVAATLIIVGFLQADMLLPGKERAVPGSKKLASVDGTAITETQARMDGAEDLESLEFQMLRSKAAFERKEHQILEAAMERLVEKKLIKEEAAKRGIPEEELLDKEVDRKIPEVTGMEIDNFYAANKQHIQKSKDEIAPEISKFIKQQKTIDARKAFLKRLEKEHKVVRFLQPLRYKVDAPGRPSLGPASAPVVIVAFTDYQCPYCKRYNAPLKEIRKRYGDKVRMVFRQFPLTSIHPYARRASEAALCAAAQNRFEAMHDSLLGSQSSLQEENLRNRANKLGLDMNAFNSCFASSRNGVLVQEDLRAAASSGVEGTPALFINGRYLNGVYPLEEIASIIDEELKNKKPGSQM